MNRRLVLRTQRNELFTAIRDLGLDPTEFLWEELNSPNEPELQVSLLIHKPTGFYFLFDYREGKCHTERSPGPDSTLDYQYPGSWELQFKYALEWLTCLKREYEAPDLWGAIALEGKLAEAAAAEGDDNAPLTPEEQDQVSGQLDEIRQYVISTHNLVEEHAEFVNRRFDYLDDALKRMGRRDWLHTLIGVLFTVVTAVSMSAEEAREIFRFAAASLQLFIDRFLPAP